MVFAVAPLSIKGEGWGEGLYGSPRCSMIASTMAGVKRRWLG